MTSAILTKLAETYPEVLNHPKVLEFWRHIDGLSEPEREEMNQRYRALDEEVRWSAIDSAYDAAAEVVGEDFRYAACLAAWFVTGRRAVFGDATLELIGDVENKVAYGLIMSYKQP
jgi:hypothetical protein